MSERKTMLSFNMKLTRLAIFLVVGLSAVGCNDEGAGDRAGDGDNGAKTPTPVLQEMMPGLSYIDFVSGQGAEVQTNDFVIVHYAGYVYENGVKGKKFESSYERGESIAFPLGQSIVIKGWEHGIPGMHVGGKRGLIVAPALGFGSQGRPPFIPANSMLYYDIEVLDIGVVTVNVQSEGSGPIAEVGDIIEVHYTGWVWRDGQKGVEFDSSSGRGIPYKFTLGAGTVVAGWDQGLVGMSLGTKASLIIPPVMGYGKRGNLPHVPPDATLYFDVELVSIAGK